MVQVKFSNESIQQWFHAKNKFWKHDRDTGAMKWSNHHSVVTQQPTENELLAVHKFPVVPSIVKAQKSQLAFSWPLQQRTTLTHMPGPSNRHARTKKEKEMLTAYEDT